MRELRKDPVLNRWVIISTERSLRPSEFEHFDHGPASGTDHPDPFAEGNEHLTPPEIYAVRAPGGRANGPDWQVRVIPNKFPALGIEGDLDPRGYGLYDRMNGIGAHEVIIETPRSGEHMHQYSLSHLMEVLSTIRLRVEDLARDMRLAYILPFKNHGHAAGASIRHAHSQIVATPVVPARVMEELHAAQAHWEEKRRSIFVDILDQELQMRERVAYENQHFLAFCPYASSSAFEVHIYPKRQNAYFRQAGTEELKSLAEALSSILRKWQVAVGDVAYNLLIRTVPNDTILSGLRRNFPYLDAYYCWHVEMFPRLSRGAGFEWGTGFYINSTPPEEAAAYLRSIEVELG